MPGWVATLPDLAARDLGGRGVFHHVVDADRSLVERLIQEEVAAIRTTIGDDALSSGRWADARALFTDLALGEKLADFLTIPAYERVP